MSNQKKDISKTNSTYRKEFLKQSGMLGGLFLANPTRLFAGDGGSS